MPARFVGLLPPCSHRIEVNFSEFLVLFFYTLISLTTLAKKTNTTGKSLHFTVEYLTLLGSSGENNIESMAFKVFGVSIFVLALIEGICTPFNRLGQVWGK